MGVTCEGESIPQVFTYGHLFEALQDLGFPGERCCFDMLTAKP